MDKRAEPSQIKHNKCRIWMDSMAKPSYPPKEILKTTIKNSQSKGLKEGGGGGDVVCVLGCNVENFNQK